MINRARAGVFLKTLGVASAYLLAVWLVYEELPVTKRNHRLDLLLALAFSVVQCSTTLLLGMVLLARKGMRRIRERRRRNLHPKILNQLTHYALGSNRLSEIQRLYESHPEEVDDCLAEFSMAIVGAGRDHLSRLARELNLVARWEKQYRSGQASARLEAIVRLGELAGATHKATLVGALEDQEESIRIEASRFLIRSGGSAEIERVFEVALSQPLLVLAVLAEDLRSKALVLCERAIPRALASADDRLLCHTLELLGAWRKSLPLPGFSLLLRRADPEVRARALRVLPYVVSATEVEGKVLSALADPDKRVRAAAAFAVGRMRMASALPQLSRLLCESTLEVALAAAHALAEMGEGGMKILEDGVCSSNPGAARAALEALSHAKIDRPEYASF